MTTYEELKSENAELHNQLRSASSRAEDADQYEQWLTTSGNAVGCGHIDEQLPNCVCKEIYDRGDIERLKATVSKAVQGERQEQFAGQK